MSKLSILNLSIVCLSLCLSDTKSNTPQYLRQMKSDLHKNFRIILLWSVKMIYDIKDDPILQDTSQEPSASRVPWLFWPGWRESACWPFGRYTTIKLLCHFVSKIDRKSTTYFVLFFCNKLYLEVFYFYFAYLTLILIIQLP